MDRLRELILKHEGLAFKPYRCTAGRLTIGVGRNLEEVGISPDEAYLMLSNDLKRVQRETLDAFTVFKSLSVPRQDVLISLVFNMGVTRVKGFKKMLKALSEGNFEKAADEMLNSKWAEQVGPRAQELALMMRLGRYVP